tara:strand:- start:59 stop:400 length:342 start_codon:yes stop_codon:yes gene_type:complete
MKHLLIICSLLLTSVSWSKDVDVKDLVERGGLFYEKFSNEPFTGNLIGRIQGKIKNGNMDGDIFVYWSDGQLALKYHFLDGKLHGEWLAYNKKGKLVKTEIWEHGKLIEKIEH